MYKETVYHDPIEKAQDMSRVLKEDEKCDLVICLSHIGYDYKYNSDRVSDLKLASACSAQNFPQHLLGREKSARGYTCLQLYPKFFISHKATERGG